MPNKIEAETDIQVGTPKLRFPSSENACPFIFLSFVHLITSHGGDGVSVSLGSSGIWLLMELCLPWFLRYAGVGEAGRGMESVELERRDWNRLSNGRKEGVGLSRPGLDAMDGNMLLPPGEDNIEPYTYNQLGLLEASESVPVQTENHLVLT